LAKNSRKPHEVVYLWARQPDPCIFNILLMRYMVRARVKPGRENDLLHAIRDQSLGRGSIAGDEYLRDMERARLSNDGTVHWVEVCFCPTPLAEERAYWEEYFELVSVKDAHARRNCRDWNGTEPWACCACDCTRRLESKLRSRGQPFLEVLDQTPHWERHNRTCRYPEDSE
jgi:hypothetical protein